MALDTLPEYDLELRKTEISNPANLHNEQLLNNSEIEEYCNKLRASIQTVYELVSTGQNENYQLLLDSVYGSLFKELTLLYTLPVLGETRVTINGFEYVIKRVSTNAYRITVDRVKLVMAKNMSNVIIYPQIKLGDTFIDLFFDQPLTSDVKIMFV